MAERTKLRPIQVAAGALAAVTAAFIGSLVGTYGTLIGAGIVSIASTVGGELYLRSLDRTKEAAVRAKELAVARAGRNGTRTLTVTRDSEPDAPADDTAFQVSEVSEVSEDDVVMVGPEPEPRRRFRWQMVVAGTVAAFVLGMAAVTGIELITGSSLSGEKGGDTVSSVFSGRSGQDSDQREQPVDREDEQQAPPSAEPSSEPSTPAVEPSPSQPSRPSEPSSSVEPPESTGPSKPPASTTEPELEPSEPLVPPRPQG